MLYCPEQTEGEETMQLMQLPNNEAAILTRLAGPDPTTLLPEAAREILTIGFGQADKDRMAGSEGGPAPLPLKSKMRSKPIAASAV